MRDETLAARKAIEARRDARKPRRPDGSFLPELAWAALARTGLRLALLHARGRSNLEDFDVVDHEVHLARLPSSFEGFRLLQLSDLHLDVYDGFVDSVREALAPLAWDACVLTGDYRYRKSGPIDPCMEALARLRPSLGDEVVAILGNHDHSGMVPVMEGLGIRMLVNEATRLEWGQDAVHILGVDDPHLYRTDDLGAATQGLDAGGCRLLLAHAPEIADEALRHGIDLMLSGHTHGGQIAWPGGRPIITNARCPRRLASGAWTWGALRGYTSRGTGSSFADARLHCRPEVVIHVLRRADSASSA